MAQERQFPFFSNILQSKYIFSDTALVKVAPSNQAAEKDTLFLGDTVQIQLQTTYHEFINGFAAPWLKVDYYKNGFQRTGFVWAGMMAIATVKDKNGLLLLGLNKTIVKDKLVGKQLQISYENEFTIKQVGSSIRKEISFFQNDLNFSAQVSLQSLDKQGSLKPVYEVKFQGVNDLHQKKYYIATCATQLINLFVSSSPKQVFKLVSENYTAIKFSLQDGKWLKQETLNYNNCKITSH